MEIGDVFDTIAEQGCVVTSLPDSEGNFLAVDAEGVECQFNLRMVNPPRTCPRCGFDLAGDGWPLGHKTDEGAECAFDWREGR